MEENKKISDVFLRRRMRKAKVLALRCIVTEMNIVKGYIQTDTAQEQVNSDCANMVRLAEAFKIVKNS